jgi:integrase
MGSVHPYETKAGKLYRIAYRGRDHKQRTERGFKTKKAAKDRLAEVEVSKNRGEYVDPGDSRATIATLTKAWLAAREPVLKPSTYRMDESAWRIHVEPRWGSLAVGKVRHGDVQAWVSQLSKDSSATTVLRAYGVLAAVLDQAVKDRRLTKNHGRGVTLPRKTGSRKIYLSHEQVDLLAEQSRRPELVRFLAYTGLRWGEATGLQVQHVDVKRRRVAVEQNAVMVGTKIEIGTPKTHENRSVPYPAFLATAIKDAMKNKPADGYLFGPGKDPMRLPNSVNGWFAAAVKRAQAKTDEARAEAIELDEDPPAHFPRVTPHDLRHTAASLAISAGANVKAVQRMLGHASAAMTLDTYAELFDDDLDTVADALDQARASSGVVKVLSEDESQT